MKILFQGDNITDAGNYGMKRKGLYVLAKKIDEIAEHDILNNKIFGSAY